MVHYLVYILCVRPDNRSVIIVRKIKDREGSSWSSTGDLRGVLWKNQTGDNSIVACLENVFGEIHLPDPQKLVLTSSNAKSWADNHAADGNVIMQLIDLF